MADFSNNVNPQNQSVDGKGADAGTPNPEPQKNTIDQLGENAGLNLEPDDPVNSKEKLDQRDSNRWELDPASQNRS